MDIFRGQDSTVLSETVMIKEGNFPVTMKDIITLAIAFKLNKEQTQELIDIAFPEFKFYKIIIEGKMSLTDANELLDEQGLDLLGTALDE